jgi:hypothetical protein
MQVEWEPSDEDSSADIDVMSPWELHRPSVTEEAITASLRTQDPAVLAACSRLETACAAILVAVRTLHLFALLSISDHGKQILDTILKHHGILPGPLSLLLYRAHNFSGWVCAVLAIESRYAVLLSRLR